MHMKSTCKERLRAYDEYETGRSTEGGGGGGVLLAGEGLPL